MTDGNILNYALFVEDIPIFDAFQFRYRHLYELGDLLHPVRRLRPNHPKQVQPSLKVPTFEAAAAAEEGFQQCMDLVYGPHRVLRIWHSTAWA